jgi:hypothetical protein
MAAKPTETVAVKVRMKEKLRRQLEVEAKRDGISVNAAIERRLNRTLIDDMIMEIIAKTASTTSKQFADTIGDHLHNLMMDKAGEFARLEDKIDQANRVLNLHELILNAKKGDASNDQA